VARVKKIRQKTRRMEKGIYNGKRKTESLIRHKDYSQRGLQTSPEGITLGKGTKRRGVSSVVST